jgi:glyoxylase-like metal-dependent hydrolase (beta-lactamase superfamily II)
VRLLAQRPFALVIDTHFHDDHAGGNALYAGMGVPVLATPATSRLVKERVGRIRAGAPKEIARLDAYEKTLGADDDRTRGFLMFFSDWWREALDDVNRDPHGVALPTEVLPTPTVRRVIGSTPVEIRTLKGRAHTGGDCVVFFPDRKVAACGDVFAKGSAPWADQFMGDGSIEGVIAAQDSLLAWLPADSTWTARTRARACRAPRRPRARPQGARHVARVRAAGVAGGAEGRRDRRGLRRRRLRREPGRLRGVALPRRVESREIAREISLTIR